MNAFGFESPRPPTEESEGEEEGECGEGEGEEDEGEKGEGGNVDYSTAFPRFRDISNLILIAIYSIC